MKKILALLLALAMVLSMAACGGTPAAPETPAEPEAPAAPAEPETPDEPQAEGPQLSADGRYPAETIKIGFLNYDTTAELYLTTKAYIEYLQTAFNIEMLWSESISSVEQELAFIEQAAAAGCDAIIAFYNVANDQSVDLCTSLGMYYWGQGFNEAIQANHSMNPLYLGSFYVGNADYQYGKGCVDALVEAGCHKIIIASGGVNFGIQMFIDRYTGAMDAVKAHQEAGYDIEVVAEVPGFPGTDGSFEAAQTEALNSDADGLASMLTALMWIQPMQAAGKFGQIKTAAVDVVSPVVVDMFGAGMYVGVSAEIADIFGMAIPMIINAMDGHAEQQRNPDGSAPLIDASWWLVTNIEDAAYLSGVESNEGGWVFDIEDIQSVLYAYNPDLTLEDMSALYTAVDAADIQARR